jgi:predicted nucleic acid-binding Zn ribbon protein
MLPIQEFTPPVLAEILRRQPPSDGRTILAWQIAVGAKLARTTTVRLADTVLTVSAADSRWVTEIEAARNVVLRRLQELLGAEAVTRIRIEHQTRR